MGRVNLIAIVASLLSIVAHRAMADELKLLTPGAVLSSLKELVPAFEQASGHRVQVTLSPALAVADRVKNDEAFDIVITGRGSAEALEKLGKLSAGSVTVISRVGVGVFVRRAMPSPMSAARTHSGVHSSMPTSSSIPTRRSAAAHPTTCTS